MRAHAALLALALVVAPAAPSAAQDKPSLEDLVARASRYVGEFSNRFANVVAEERYRQQVSSLAAPMNFTALSRGGLARAAESGSSSSESRDLRSDFLLVTVPASNELVPFRDTYEVDGTAVRDREARLAKLFLQASTTALDQARAITDESARYNIGNITRTINNPILVLLPLDAMNVPHFVFTLDKPDSSMGPGVWTVDYRESWTPTIVRGLAGRDLPSHGRLWIEAATGRVRKAELRIEELSVAASLTTTFRADTAFQIDVPSEMREEYRLKSSQITGRATYSRFRRFAVNTDEAIQK